MAHLRRTRIAALAVLLLATLAACGGGADGAGEQAAGTAAPEGADAPESASEPVTLEYLTFSAAPDHLEDLDAIVAAFEEQNPAVTIEVQTAPYEEYFTQLQTRVAGGSAPDTFELNYENFVTYAAAGTLLELGPLTERVEGFEPDAYYPRAYEVFQVDGAQYGLPATFSVVLLFFNKDLFDAAGVAYPTAEWTWEDERAAAERLTDKANGVYGDFQPVTFFEFYKALAQNDGAFFDEDRSEATFDEAEGVEAARWLLEKVGTVMPTDAELGGQDDVSLFQSGKLAMWHNGIWQFSGLQDAAFEWDVVTEPGNADDPSQFFSNAVVASADTEHPEEAVAWMQFLAASETAVETRLAADWELPAVADESLFSSYLEQTPPENREAVFDALDNIVVPPVIEQQTRMQDAVTAALERAELGQAPVEQALSEAAAEVEELLP